MASADPFKLQGKLALVTGSTAGIGRAIALLFARHGATVIVNGRSPASTAAAAKQIAEAAGVAESNLIAVSGDISSKAGSDEVIAAIRKVESDRSQTLDILVNNMGIFHVQDFFDITDEKWTEYFDTNVLSGVRLTRVFLKDMLQKNYGRVLFVSSEVAERPLAHMTAYSMSKAAQVNLARGLAELTKGTNVTVNSLLPGPTMTEGVVKYMEDFGKSKGIATLEEATATYFKHDEPTSLLQRYLQPEEVANAALFLCSAMGSGVNGNAQRVEGGIIRHI